MPFAPSFSNYKNTQKKVPKQVFCPIFINKLHLSPLTLSPSAQKQSNSRTFADTGVRCIAVLYNQYL
jgi:hypothetical protein